MQSSIQHPNAKHFAAAVAAVRVSIAARLSPAGSATDRLPVIWGQGGPAGRASQAAGGERGSAVSGARLS